jgi:hypothetical protein
MRAIAMTSMISSRMSTVVRDQSGRRRLPARPIGRAQRGDAEWSCAEWLGVRAAGTVRSSCGAVAKRRVAAVLHAPGHCLCLVTSTRCKAGALVRTVAEGLRFRTAPGTTIGAGSSCERQGLLKQWSGMTVFVYLPHFVTFSKTRTGLQSVSEPIIHRPGSETHLSFRQFAGIRPPIVIFLASCVDRFATSALDNSASLESVSCAYP